MLDKLLGELSLYIRDLEFYICNEIENGKNAGENMDKFLGKFCFEEIKKKQAEIKAALVDDPWADDLDEQNKCLLDKINHNEPLIQDRVIWNNFEKDFKDKSKRSNSFRDFIIHKFGDEHINEYDQAVAEEQYEPPFIPGYVDHEEYVHNLFEIAVAIHFAPELSEELYILLNQARYTYGSGYYSATGALCRSALETALIHLKQSKDTKFPRAEEVKLQDLINNQIRGENHYKFDSLRIDLNGIVHGTIPDKEATKSLFIRTVECINCIALL